MNKQELIAQVAEKTELSKKQVATALDATLESIVAAVADGEDVRLIGFGLFEPSRRKARTGRNPKTRELVEIPATVVPTFKPSKTFKKRVSK